MTSNTKQRLLQSLNEDVEIMTNNENRKDIIQNQAQADF